MALKDKSTTKISAFNLDQDRALKHPISATPILTVAEGTLRLKEALTNCGMKDHFVQQCHTKGCLDIMVMCEVRATVPVDIAQKMKASVEFFPMEGALEKVYYPFLARCEAAEKKRTLQTHMGSTQKLVTPSISKTPAREALEAAEDNEGEEEEHDEELWYSDDEVIEDSSPHGKKPAGIGFASIFEGLVSGSSSASTEIYGQLLSYNRYARETAEKVSTHLGMHLHLARRVLEKPHSAPLMQALHEYNLLSSGEVKLEKHGLELTALERELGVFPGPYVLYELMKKYLAGNNMKSETGLTLLEEIMNMKVGDDAANFVLKLQRNLQILSQTRPALCFDEEDRKFLIVKAFEQSSRPEHVKLGKEMRDMVARADQEGKVVTVDTLSATIQRVCSSTTKKSSKDEKGKQKPAAQGIRESGLAEIANGAAAEQPRPGSTPGPAKSPGKVAPVKGQGKGKGKNKKPPFCRICEVEGHYLDSPDCPNFQAFTKLKESAKSSVAHSAKGALHEALE
jgi:hypothetical protein